MRRSLLAIGLSAALAAGCGPVAQVALTRGERYSKLYEESPLTLLVMPPINNSMSVDAKELLYTSISKPLVEAGYYVLSPNLVMDFLKSESAYDSELFIESDLSSFREHLGADAVIFSVIDSWKKKGLGISTEISYVLKSTRSNEVLFERSCDLFLDLSVNSGTGSLVGLLAELVASAITTAVTDHIVAARRCNGFIFNDLPFGKYNPQFGQDKGLKALPQEVKTSVK